ncbi:hypothetical protein HHL19_17650 [Streptomyces sp. R302]|uniref:hypothetical protein n=1 Tax=unclassified Streptomyces TaxID=2593676 RepID=UPI00145E5149|nr:MULTISPECIES: hypothetical protein [unclassified Streptomyces]NML52613.1 hypothetical protein [Streptomyces sp. R301]NML80458.1 hypothetical protein [Streptomyces sp. R302]
MRTRAVLVALVAASAVFGLTGSAQAAASGDVVVFSTELQPLDVYRDPVGCRQLPVAAHVLNNQTDGPVRIYGNPFCLGPSVVVQPGYGVHVPGGAGSFSA